MSTIRPENLSTIRPGRTLIAIAKKELKLPASLYTLLQILSVSVFEKTQLQRALWADQVDPETPNAPKQLILFDI